VTLEENVGISNYGAVLKYRTPRENDLTEYGRLALLELPAIFARMEDAFEDS
jgi:hypothetical protein